MESKPRVCENRLARDVHPKTRRPFTISSSEFAIRLKQMELCLVNLGEWHSLGGKDDLACMAKYTRYRMAESPHWTKKHCD